MKGIIIAGTSSSDLGKTCIAIGIMAACKRRGLCVQPFKFGSDFLIPRHHLAATGKDSVNLDNWMLTREVNTKCFLRHSARADLSIAEGVVGLFGCQDSESGCTSDMAKALDLPVILVIDAWNLAPAALMVAINSLDSDVRIVGIVFNKICGSSHLSWLSEIIDDSPLRGRVLGGLQKSSKMDFLESRLRFHQPGEADLPLDYVDRLADIVEEGINIDFVIKVAEEAKFESVYPSDCSGGDEHGMKGRDSTVKQRVDSAGHRISRGKRVRIGVAKDSAFCFYYNENLSLLEEAGADIVYFSPLSDTIPPRLDGIYLGGGYPELFAEKLNSNKKMLYAIKAFAAAGGVVFAECGGLMYLSKTIETKDGSRYDMCGVFPFTTRMLPDLKMGYVQLKGTDENSLFPPEIGNLRGQVFYYSEVEFENDHTGGSMEDILPGYRVLYPNQGLSIPETGYIKDGVLASYVHIHFGSNFGAADSFVKRCRANSSKAASVAAASASAVADSGPIAAAAAGAAAAEAVTEALLSEPSKLGGLGPLEREKEFGSLGLSPGMRGHWTWCAGTAQKGGRRRFRRNSESSWWNQQVSCTDLPDLIAPQSKSAQKSESRNSSGLDEITKRTMRRSVSENWGSLQFAKWSPGGYSSGGDRQSATDSPPSAASSVGEVADYQVNLEPGSGGVSPSKSARRSIPRSASPIPFGQFDGIQCGENVVNGQNDPYTAKSGGTVLFGEKLQKSSSNDSNRQSSIAEVVEEVDEEEEDSAETSTEFPISDWGFDSDANTRLCLSRADSDQEWPSVKESEKIVSLDPVVSQILVDLGVGQRLTAISDKCHLPENSTGGPEVLSKLNAAWLRRTRPDIIFTQNELALTQYLAEADLSEHKDTAVTIVQPIFSLPEAFELILCVGRAVQLENMAFSIVNQLRARLRKVVSSLSGKPRPSLLCLSSIWPPIMAGKSTSEIISLSGADVLEGCDNDELLSSVSGLKPDVMFLLADFGNLPRIRSQLKHLATLPGFWNLPAVRKGEVYICHNADFNTLGMKTVKYVEMLAALLHPNKVTELIEQGVFNKLTMAPLQKCAPEEFYRYFKAYPAPPPEGLPINSADASNTTARQTSEPATLMDKFVAWGSHQLKRMNGSDKRPSVALSNLQSVGENSARGGSRYSSSSAVYGKGSSDVGMRRSVSHSQVQSPIREPVSRSVSREGYKYAHPSFVPRRIVSLDPSVTETLVELGVGSKLIGTTDQCKVPEDRTKKPHVVCRVRRNRMISIETIIRVLKFCVRLLQIEKDDIEPDNLILFDIGFFRSSKPDMIFVEYKNKSYEMNRALVSTALQKANLKRVAVCDIGTRVTFQQVYDSVISVGRAVGQSEKAISIVDRMRARMQLIDSRISGESRPRVLCLTSASPLVVSSQCFPEMIAFAGGICEMQEVGRPEKHIEWRSLVSCSPDVIFLLADMHDQVLVKRELRKLASHRDFFTLPAVKANRVFILDRNYFSVFGSKLADRVETMAWLLHPSKVQSCTKSGVVAKLSLNPGEPCSPDSVYERFVVLQQWTVNSIADLSTPAADNCSSPLWKKNRICAPEKAESSTMASARLAGAGWIGGQDVFQKSGVSFSGKEGLSGSFWGFDSEGCTEKALLQQGVDPLRLKPSTEPKTIVSLTPAVTETLIELGLQDRLQGKLAASDTPAGSQAGPHAQTSFSDNPPDLLIMDETAALLESSLAALKEVVRVNSVPQTLSEAIESLVGIGERVNRRTEALSLALNLQMKLRQVAGSVAGQRRPRAVCLSNIWPPVLAGNWVPEMIGLAGGNCGLQEAGQAPEEVALPPVQAELASDSASWQDLVSYSPEFLFMMIDFTDAERAKSELKQLEALPGFWSIPAVKSRRLYLCSGRELTFPGIAAAVDLFGSLLHPREGKAAMPGSAVVAEMHIC